jgi:hypothetical protein
MAADDYATRHHHPHSLARALVNMATRGVAPSCAFAIASGGVPQRVHRLLDNERSSKKTALAAGIGAAVVLAIPLSLMVAL